MPMILSEERYAFNSHECKGLNKQQRSPQSDSHKVCFNLDTDLCDGHAALLNYY